MLQGPIAAQQGNTRQTDGAFPQEAEVATTVADGFTLASVGDVILAYPQSQNPDRRIEEVIDLVRNADVATGNYEENRR